MNSISIRRGPQRIVCLTEETTEWLYALNQQHRIVGISGYTVRPKIARQEKPKVSAFLTAKIDQILALKPDLVLGFSDLQADIAAELIRRGVQVLIFNQRSVQEILDMLWQLAMLVDAQEEGETCLQQIGQRMTLIREEVSQWPRRPKVYFEEWDTPNISAILWVSELIDWAGGDDIFPELAQQSLGKHRIIADPMEVVRRNPDLILGSWCGKKFRPDQVMQRAGWHAISAVQQQQVFEIKSPLILQPGPAALTDGLEAIFQRTSQWQKQQLQGA